MKSLGRYEVRSKVSRSALCELYRGHDTMLNRPVTIKLMNPALAGDPAWVERFRRRALLAGQLNHRNVVTTLDYGEERDEPYIVLEYLDGVTVEALIRQRTELPIEQKINIIGQTARGLGYMAGRGLIHGNVRPATIHVTCDGSVKVTGLEMTRLADGESDAPEDHSGQAAARTTAGRTQDPRSDLFLVGACFYELLTCRRPFVGETIAELVHAMVNHDAAPLEELRGTQHEWVEEVVTRCLCRDPARRWTDCAELATVLADELLKRCPGAPSLQPLPESAQPNPQHWRKPLETGQVGRAAAAELAKARRLLDGGHLEEAIERLAAARKAHPFQSEVIAALQDAQAQHRSIWRDDHLRRAEQALERGDHVEAAASVQRALLLDADSLRARELLAVLDARLQTSGPHEREAGS